MRSWASGLPKLRNAKTPPRLRSEARATPTGFGRIGVIESKPASVKAIVVVDRRTHEVQPVALIHVDRNALDLKLAVLLSLFIKP